MSIGEALARSRRRAGLSVAQVSEQTRIRETIIRGIEDDDYSRCGGDFYARGHIRAIAQAVGTDPAPLIREYDGVHRAPGADGVVTLEELLATSAQSPQRRGLTRPAMRQPVARAPRSSGRRGSLAAVLGLALVVALGFGIYRLLSASPHAAVAPPAAGDHPVAGRHARHGTPSLAPKASHAAAASSRTPAMPAPAPAPAHAAAAGQGTGRQSPARPSDDQRSPPGRLAHRRAGHRLLREPAPPGHASAPRHGPEGRGHPHAHPPRQGLRHRVPAGRRHQARTGRKAARHAGDRPERPRRGHSDHSAQVLARPPANSQQGQAPAGR